MTFSKLILAIFILVIAFSCNRPKVQETIQNAKWNKFDDNLHFIGDSLFNNKTALLKQIIYKYEFDTCGIINYEDSSLRNYFEGTKVIGDINGNKIIDTVFVMPPFNYCDQGDSYYFFDTTLPRLYGDSYCCHPNNLFSIGDIDEDGISEICVFYSSCSSRFKALVAYSLKNKIWKQIGRSTFDVAFMIPDKEKRVQKVSKGKFQMLEIIDKAENKEWKQFSF